MNIRVVTEADRAAVYALRFEVFVDEQKVPAEIEIDEEDERAIHIIAEEDGVAIGCGRILLSDTSAFIGRIAVKKARRKTGVGAAVCRFMFDYCRARGCKSIGIHAQVQAVGFYEKLGFRQYGAIFTEAGIPHVAMTCTL